MMGQPRMNPELPLLEHPTNEKYVLAAQIKRQAEDRERCRCPAKPAEEPKTADADDR